MTLSHDEKRSSPAIRREYKQLRSKDRSPMEICNILGVKYDKAPSRIRMIISFAAPEKICKRCWVEFRANNNNAGTGAVHLCRKCKNIYQQVRYGSNPGKYTPSKFYKPDELFQYAHNTFGMTRQQFGEALGDVTVRSTNTQSITHQTRRRQWS